MEGLFEAILSNPFLILLILGGIFSFFKGNPEKSQQEQQQRPSGRPTQTHTRTAQEKSTPVHIPQETNIDSLSIEEHRDEQMERLREQLNTGEHRLPDISKSDSSAPKVVHSHETSYKYNEFKKDMKRNLTKQGLIDSIVMAEVLGPPRARKPYRNIINERKSL